MTADRGDDDYCGGVWFFRVLAIITIPLAGILAGLAGWWLGLTFLGLEVVGSVGLLGWSKGFQGLQQLRIALVLVAGLAALGAGLVLSAPFR